MKTTILTNNKTKKLLLSLSEKTGESRSKVLIAALNYYLQNTKIKKYVYRTIEYQKRECKESWFLFHIKYTFAEYEQISDLKNIQKKSFSLIIALAVEYYGKNIDDIENNSNYYSDNYRPHIYVTVIKNDEKVKGFEYYWGIPDENTIERIKN